MIKTTVHDTQMNTHLKSFLAGIGSIIAIYPATSYSSFVPHGDAESRMRASWEKTGESLKDALNQYNVEKTQE